MIAVERLTLVLSMSKSREKITSYLLIILVYLVLWTLELGIICAMYASFQIPKPTDEQVLERAPLELFRCVLGDPNVTTYGRRGQSQQGVDLYGKRDRDPSQYVGIQCKLKSSDKPLTEKIVREEVTKALSFEPELSEYFIVTTAPDDAAIQKLARLLETEIKKQHGRTMSIQIWGWNTMEREIQRHPSALKEFIPDFTPFSERLDEGIQKVSAGQSELLNKMDALQVSLAPRDGALIGSSDSPSGDPFEQHLDGEIDTFREYINKKQPRTALDLFSGLQKRLGSQISDRIQFRIKANMAFCFLDIGEKDKGLDLLLEACAHTPDTPKAIAHKALVSLLKGDWEKVLTISRKGLNRDPNNEELASYHIQALRFAPQTINPLEEIPDCLKAAKQVEIAHLFFLRQRDISPAWWDKAHELFEKYPDENFVAQAFAESTLDRILTEEQVNNRYQIPERHREDLLKAHNELLQLWNNLDFTQSAPQIEDFGLFTNLILSCDLLSFVEKAKELTASCPAEFLADNDVAVRLAQLAFNSDELELFSNATKQISDDHAKFHFEFYGALEKRNWEKIVDLTDNEPNSVRDDDKEIVSLTRAVAKLMVFEGEVFAAQILETEKLVAEDLRGLVLIYDTLIAMGFETEAKQCYERALQAILESGQHSAQSMLAQRAAKREDWVSVNRLLVGFVDCRQDNYLLGMLASSYVNISPPTKAAVDFFKHLPDEISQKPYYLERAAVFHFNRGALAQSEECYRAAIAATDRAELAFYMPLLSLLLRRQKLQAVNELVTEMLDLDLQGNGEEQVWFSHFLMKHGHPERAISVSYAALQSAPESAETHSGFCGLILMNTRLGPNERIIPNIAVIGEDCWVEIEKENGERRQFLISNNPKMEASHLFPMVVDLTHDLAMQCKGKKVGGTFRHSNGFGMQAAQWKIVEIKHKFTQACHVIMDEFDVRFPNSRIMAKMTMPDDSVEPILEHIREHSERKQKNTEFYTKQGFPISVLAAIQGSTAIEYAGFLRNLGHTIQACRGLEKERKDALELIATRRTEGVTIDALTAWVMYWTESIEIVKRVFGTVKIAQSCLDDITKMVVEAENDTEGRFSIVWKDGHYYRDEQSSDDIRAFVERVKRVRSKIVEHCEIVPSEAPETIPDTSRELIQSFSSDLLDPAFCAARGGLLLSEDMFYRQLVTQEFGVSGIWLQSVLMFAVSEKLIGFEEYCEKCVLLAENRHGHLAVTSDVLVQIALNQNDRSWDKFNCISEVIGTADADIESHYNVAHDTVVRIWHAKNLSFYQKQKFASTILFKLVRHRKEDWQDILAMMYVRMGRQFRAYLQNWVQAHFLPTDVFNAAVTNLMRFALSD